MLASGIAAAQGDCFQWSNQFAYSTLGGTISDSVMYDDGTGLHLYVAGRFASSTDSSIRNIAKWDGTRWVGVGGGLGGQPGFTSASALQVFDEDGNGPARPSLFVGGTFNEAGTAPAANIARWDGVTWTALAGGTDGSVSVMSLHDDGSGVALYAGGQFDVAGGLASQCIARWRNGAWSAVGTGFAASSGPPTISALATFQGSLFATGRFDTAGGVSAAGIARFQNGSWFNLLTGLRLVIPPFINESGVGDALVVAPAGPGGAEVLVVGGGFTNAATISAQGIVAWNGASFSRLELANALSHPGPSALALFDDGDGSALYANASFPGGSGVGRWNGVTWDLVGANNSSIATLTQVAPGLLFAGGDVDLIAGVPVPNAGFWNTNTWTPAGAFLQGLNDPATVVRVLDAGDGPRLYAAGSFTVAGGALVPGIARWGNAGWEPLPLTGAPVGTITIQSVLVHDDGSGPALYAAGKFANIGGVAALNIARWRPSTGWQSVGSGLNGSSSPSPVGAVYMLAEHDDGSAPSLVATGEFRNSGATSGYNGIARWNGTTWQTLGNGMGSTSAVGLALASFDADGDGPEPRLLYAGGAISSIRVWDGAAWTIVSDAPATTITSALRVLDTGSGPVLYAGGNFTGAVPGMIYSFDGEAWTRVGQALAPLSNPPSVAWPPVTDFEIMTVDGESTLFASGLFYDPATSTGLAMQLREGAWNSLAAGLGVNSGGKTAMAVYDTGHGPSLWTAGSFRSAALTSTEFVESHHIARWEPCLTPCGSADFDGDGDVGTDADIEAFFACLGGDCCASCQTADFDVDGDTGTDADIEAFFRVLAGGSC